MIKPGRKLKAGTATPTTLFTLSSPNDAVLPGQKTQIDRWQSSAELVPKLMQRLGLRERLRETEVIDAWSKIVGDFIAAHSAPVALREGILYVRVLQPALHYELEQISKSEILRKLKQRFGGKTIRDVRFRVG